MARAADPPVQPRERSDSSPIFTLRILVYPKGGKWYAHCLDLDLITARPQKLDAYRELLTQIRLYLEEAAESEHPEQLIPRKAPLSLRLLFHALSIRDDVINLFGRTSAGSAFRLPFDKHGHLIGA